MTGGFYQQDGRWHADGIALSDIARRYGTPCYVYSEPGLRAAYAGIAGAFAQSGARVCYAVKANDNLSVLAVLAAAGAGFDIVSGGELARVLAAGGAAAGVVFSGAGKRGDEIDAALDAGIGCFNVESAAELARLSHLAAVRGAVAPVALRVTFDIDGGTHRHLTTGMSGGKFGIARADALTLARQAAADAHTDFLGYSCHIGSQINDEETYLRLAQAMAELVGESEAQGIAAPRVDMGGGFAVDDAAVAPPPPALRRYDEALARHFAGRQLIVEPGRSIVAAAGALLTRVEYVKESGGKTLWIADAGMNDFLRPALYGAALPVLPAEDSGAAAAAGDIAGPVCENADILARDRSLSAAEGDVLVVFNAGAYGAVMASNYNARPRPAAVMTCGGKMRVVRRAETPDDMMAAERLSD